MEKKFKKLLAMTLSLSMILTSFTVPMKAEAASSDALKFGLDGKFKILVFADTQDDTSVDARLISKMELALEKEKPDLVVFTGDQTEMNIKDPEDDFRNALEQILQPVVDADIPYAFTFGNHDDQSYYSGQRTDKDAMFAVYQSIGDCRTTDPAPELTGTGTCKIPIYGSNGSSVAFNIWMVDSGTYQNPLDTGSGYDNPHEDQLTWMKQNNDAGVNSLVFQHIPMPEIYNLLVEDANGEKSYGGKKYKLELNSNATGHLGEFPCPIYAEDNRGEFAALKEMGNVLGVFTGHDHLNDFTGTYDGIDMTAVPGMTFQSYGDDAVRGYGVIVLNENDLSDYDYHSVKYTELDAWSEEASKTTYDVYDEVTYDDLRLNGQPLASEHTLSGGFTLTYEATSPSYSAVLKYRLKAGSKAGFQFSFDQGATDSISHPFGVWIKRPDQSGPNGSWHLKPNIADMEVKMGSPIAKGDVLDIELGRLKILTGTNAGQYYVYLKVNGELIQEGYSAVDENGYYTSGGRTDCHISNELFFGCWGNGAEDKITAIPEPETYEAYDLIEYYDLMSNGTWLAAETEMGSKTFTYNKTSPTSSAVLKFRWKAVAGSQFQLSFDRADKVAYMFGAQLCLAGTEGHTSDSIRLRPGLDSQAWRDLPANIESGKNYDIEFARLKVKTGENKGKYYVYFKVNGELISDSYVAENVVDSNGNYTTNPDGITCSFSNQIYLTFWGQSGNKITGIPAQETFDNYDDLTFDDLYIGSTSMNGQEMSGNQTYTYNATSSSYSMRLRYRWIAGGDKLKFTAFLDNSWKYPFWFEVKTPNQSDLGKTAGPNGAWHLVPSKDSYIVDMDEPIVAGQAYDIEIGRMKVVTGAMKNKYYVYWKVNDELIFSYYYDGVINGTYEGVALSNQIRINLPEGNKITAIPIPETYEDYDDLTFDELYLDGAAVGDTVVDGGDRKYTYDATSSSYSMKLNFRWTAGDTARFTAYLDDWVFPFCFAAKEPNRSDFGAAAGENGAWHLVPSNGDLIVQMDKPIASGDTHDIEIGRLKVKTGKNTGKYYVYWKVDGELIQSYYYDGVGEDGTYGNGTALSNKIIIAAIDGNKFSAIPFEEKYEDYDDLSFDDLYSNGESVSGKEVDGGWKTFTYDATSSSYSMKLKYRWVPGGDELGHTTFLDDDVFPFCFSVKTPNRDDFGAAAGPNGAWHLVPSNPDLIVQMDEPIVAGVAYDFEIGRLKVTNGENAGKYYVYWKVNDELIQSYYYDGVNEDGTYGNGTALSNQIIISSSTGNTFSAIPIPETYEDYDDLTFDELYLDGTSVGSMVVDGGNRNYTYNPTSSSYSMKLNFRWTAGDTARFTAYLDDWVFPFCFAAKEPNRSDFGAAAGENGAWHLVPSDASKIVQMTSPIVAGTELDIEIGRLKVKTGANAGKYYVYFKADDQLIQSYYYDGVSEDGTYGNSTALSNKIIISAPTGNTFKTIPIPETFEDFDEISFNDLYEGDTSMFGKEMDGSHNYTYNATSPTYSMKLKYRWTAGSEPKFTTYLDDWKYPFCFAVKTPNQTGFGAAAGENGAWHLVPSNNSMIVQMDEPIVVGRTYDIEVGRLKVKTGTNTGKYYVYFMVNDELIQSYYYDGVVDGVYDGVALSNKIIISAPSGNKFTDYPFVEEYEAYDEIGFKDLLEEDGTPVGSQKLMSGGTTLKYNKTSPTGSIIFKYRWKTGDVPKFQMSFEKTSDSAMSYMFGAWLSAPEDGAPNGWLWLRPAYGPKVNLSTAITTDTSYNVEFARLKVKNGPNAGKYYVYIKLDGVLIAEDYVAADVVDSNGKYTTDPGATTCTLSNEIFFAFWGSEGNIISPYRTLGFDEHAGNLGDFDGDGTINEADVEIVRKLLAGLLKLSDLPEGIADFNNDGSVDSRDLVAIKKYFLPIVNEYTRPGSMTLGMQEHLGEDESKTATYIADVTATMGANAYRLSRPIHSLYYVTNSNGVAVKEENMAVFREMVNALKAKGITEILYVTDSFILPWDYADPTVNHNETVPNPVTEPENYVAWLTVNAAAFKALAQEFPEIKFFEPYNEINVLGDSLEKPGIPWDETDEVLIAAHRYNVEEKAAIMADLCWYITRAVKSVDIRNQVTTPSIVVGTNSAIQNNFLEAFYDAIESGDYPTGNAVADVKIDNYFTIVNLHAYPDYADAPGWFETDKSQANVNTWAEKITEAYNVVKTHNDGGSRVWLTETGMSTYDSDGDSRDESRVANMIGLALEKLDEKLTFVDTVIFYEIAEMTNANAQNTIASEAHFGLFYASDHSSKAYEAKAIAKKIYSFFHSGTTDYSALDALANRYK